MPRKRKSVPMEARNLVVGDRFLTAVGEVEVVGLWASHGGVEVDARPTKHRKDGKENTSSRVLWLYLCQSTEVTRTAPARSSPLQKRPPKNPNGPPRGTRHAA